MLPATPEADELQQLPLELPRYLLVALRESGGHRAYALLPPYVAAAVTRWHCTATRWCLANKSCDAAGGFRTPKPLWA